MRICSRCAAPHDKEQGYCAECLRQYNRENYARDRYGYKTKVKSRTKHLGRLMHAAIIQAKSVPCTDCGIQYPSYVMEFDHLEERGAKEFDISKARKVAGSMQRLRAELAKCEVVCSNCHQVRTHQRRQSVNKRFREKAGNEPKELELWDFDLSASLGAHRDEMAEIACQQRFSNPQVADSNSAGGT